MEVHKSCLFCFNRPSVSTVTLSTLNSVSPQRMISSCNKYLSSDLLLEVNWTSIISDGAAPFCDECVRNTTQLSILHDQLIQIEKDIEKLATIINFDVAAQRSIYQSNKTRNEVSIYESNNATTSIFQSDVNWSSQPAENENFNRQVSWNHFEDDFSEPTTFHSTTKRDKPAKSGAKKTAVCEDKLPHIQKATTGFKCDKCSKTFARLTILESHDCNKVTYDCETCSLSFSGPSVLKLHVSRTHAGEKPFKCDTCQKSFGFRHHLVRHIRLHTGEKPFECDICNRKFSDQTEMTNHLRKHENIRYNCTLCDKSFAHNQSLRDHLKCHVNSEEFKCDICNAILSSAPGLTTHKKSHTNRTRPFVCEQCGKSFFKASDLKKHMSIHEEDQNIKCEFCDKIFSRKDKLKNHKYRVHSGKEESFICETCGKTFPRLFLYNIHMKCHVVDYANVCHICGKKYKEKTKLKVHIKTDHEGEKPFKCEHCEEAFKYRRPLLRHKIKKHLDIIDKNKFCTCEVCKKPFPLAAELLSHQIISHYVTAGNSVKCLLCSQKFANTGTYRWHIHNTPHLGRYLINCNRCEEDDEDEFNFATYCDYFCHLKTIHREVFHARYTCKSCDFIMPATTIKTHICVPIDSSESKCETGKSQNTVNSSVKVKPKTMNRMQTRSTKQTNTRKITAGRFSVRNNVKYKGKGKYVETDEDSEENEYPSSVEENSEGNETEDEKFVIKEEIESSCDSDDPPCVDVQVKLEVVESDSPTI